MTRPDPYEMLLLTAEEDLLLEAAMQEFRDGESDVKGDHPEGTWEAGGYWEIGQSVAGNIESPRVEHEFRRINDLPKPSEDRE